MITTDHDPQIVQALDRHGRLVRVGDTVRVAGKLRVRNAHREFVEAFQRVAGRVRKVVGWDKTGGAWIDAGRREVITIEPRLLTIVRRGRTMR